MGPQAYKVTIRLRPGRSPDVHVHGRMVDGSVRVIAIDASDRTKVRANLAEAMRLIPVYDGMVEIPFEIDPSAG
jgi:hypothetical protein